MAEGPLHFTDDRSPPLSDEDFVKAGYIRVYQDVRGKYGSEGDYLMTPPPVGSGFNNTGADDTTDAYDTIDWLVKNVPESNGRVGMIGSSYEGFTVVMALLHPHPALKAAAPESPMVDGWMGDDWFHYGAFRQTNLDYISRPDHQARRRLPGPPRRPRRLRQLPRLGSAGDVARAKGEDQLPFWKIIEAHPAYDAFWQGQALDHLLAAKALTVPTIWEQGMWDQEDMWGAIHTYRALEPRTRPTQLPRHGPLVPLADQPRRPRPRPLPVDRRHRRAVASRHPACPSSTPVPQARLTQIRHSPRPHLRHRRRPLGPPAKPGRTAANRLPRNLEAALPRRQRHLSFDLHPPPGRQSDEYVSDPAKPVPYLAPSLSTAPTGAPGSSPISASSTAAPTSSPTSPNR